MSGYVFERFSIPTTAGVFTAEVTQDELMESPHAEMSMLTTVVIIEWHHGRRDYTLFESYDASGIGEDLVQHLDNRGSVPVGVIERWVRLRGGKNFSFHNWPTQSTAREVIAFTDTNETGFTANAVGGELDMVRAWLDGDTAEWSVFDPQGAVVESRGGHYLVPGEMDHIRSEAITLAEDEADARAGVSVAIMEGFTPERLAG